MLYLALGLLAALTAPPTQTPSAQATNDSNHPVLVIDVTGFENTDGQFVVNVFATGEGFPDQTTLAVRTRTGPVDPDGIRVVINDLAHGEYAVAVLHDEDIDGEVDKNFLGIPKESYGASNDARRRFGPPLFTDAAFSLTTDRTISIGVR